MKYDLLLILLVDHSPCCLISVACLLLKPPVRLILLVRLSGHGLWGPLRDSTNSRKSHFTYFTFFPIRFLYFGSVKVLYEFFFIYSVLLCLEVSRRIFLFCFNVSIYKHYQYSLYSFKFNLSEKLRQFWFNLYLKVNTA